MPSNLISFFPSHAHCTHSFHTSYSSYYVFLLDSLPLLLFHFLFLLLLLYFSFSGFLHSSSLSLSPPPLSLEVLLLLTSHLPSLQPPPQHNHGDEPGRAGLPIHTLLYTLQHWVATQRTAPSEQETVPDAQRGNLRVLAA